MKPLRLHSLAEQVADHLRKEIQQGILSGDMPGAKRLASSLGINHKTVDSAAAILGKQGFLVSQGPGRPRRITLPVDSPRSSLRIALLIYEPADALFHPIIELRHALTNAGHSCLVADKSQKELGWDVQRIAKLVEKTEADAWIIRSGSREILEWFTHQPLPFFAVHGRFVDHPIAAVGVSMIPAIENAVDQLVALGHRRIVAIARESDIVPTLGAFYQKFIERLQFHGIQTGSYNLPIWDCNPKGLHGALGPLFSITPPTAVFVCDIVLFYAVQTQLLRMGFPAPDKVSLVTTEFDTRFEWSIPTISHIGWSHQAILKRVIEWADNVGRGKPDLKQKLIDCEFVTGGTIGPVERLQSSLEKPKDPEKGR